MKKIYEATNCRVFSMSVGGKRIVFSDGDAYQSARMVTDDEKVQQAIEKSALFGQSVRLVFDESRLTPATKETNPRNDAATETDSAVETVPETEQPAEVESPAVEAAPEEPKTKAKGRPKK